MRRRLAALLVLGCLLAQSAAPLLAQGPVYRERWGYLHLERLRQQVLQELEGRAPADVAAAAQQLAQKDGGNPFRPVARALAELRGVACDEAFLTRSTISLYVLPEVVDPTSTVKTCRAANFSVFLPSMLESPGALTFELLVRDEADKVVWQQAIKRDTSVLDLRMARPRAEMPVDPGIVVGLADGRYVVELRTTIDGEGPRPTDYRLQWPFFVMRGYQQRTEAAMVQFREVQAGLAPVPRALLAGFAQRVSNAYAGREFVVDSRAPQELQRLEQALANVAAKRDPLAGMVGMVRTALPAGDTLLPCTLRIPAEGAKRARPTVVFVGAAPSYNGGTRRPTAPSRRAPGWLAHELGDFGDEQDWNVVCLQSPGAGRPFPKDLLAALPLLPQVLACEGKPLLCCDREAGGVLALQLDRLAPHVAGVVMAGAGAMPERVFDALQGVPVRLVSLSGYAGTLAIDRMLAFVEQRQRDGKSTPDIARLHPRQLPWTFGLPLSRNELQAFASECFARR